MSRFDVVLPSIDVLHLMRERLYKYGRCLIIYIYIYIWWFNKELTKAVIL